MPIERNYFPNSLLLYGSFKKWVALGKLGESRFRLALSKPCPGPCPAEVRRGLGHSFDLKSNFALVAVRLLQGQPPRQLPWPPRLSGPAAPPHAPRAREQVGKGCGSMVLWMAGGVCHNFKEV